MKSSIRTRFSAANAFARIAADVAACLTLVLSAQVVAQPVIDSVTPDAGSIFGGTEVTITGSGFADGMFVIFGELPATDVQVVVGGNTLTARTPGARPGVVDVAVVIDEEFDVLPNAFTFSLLCTEVVVDNCFTEYSANGGPMPENVIPEIQVGSVQISLVDADIEGGGLDRFELSPTISNADVLVLALKLDETFDDPIIAISTGRIEQWSWDTGTRVASIEIQPGPSSWSIDGCDPEVCAAQASIDYTSFVLISLDTMQLPEGAGEEFETFIAAMDGAFISTNAQFFSPPTFDFVSETLQTQVGAPSLKFDGTANFGSFRTLVPYAVVTEVWGVSDPTVITDAEATVIVDGVEVDFSIEHVEASGFSPAGILFELDSFPYSAPIIDIKVVDVEDIACSVEEDLVLDNQTITDMQTFEACNTITATNFTVASTADVTFRAGQRITLGEGFHVEQGGKFTTQIDPTIE